MLNKSRLNKNAFTLIEMLVVVLIIAILAAIAIPQYMLSTEKTKIAEAIENLNSIALANQRYYMATGAYMGRYDIDALDISIPGTISSGRKETDFFVYAPNGSSNKSLAIANRKPYGERYYLNIWQASPTKVECVEYTDITAAQQKLCDEINLKGSL